MKNYISHGGGEKVGEDLGLVNVSAVEEDGLVIIRQDLVMEQLGRLSSLSSPSFKIW